MLGVVSLRPEQAVAAADPWSLADGCWPPMTRWSWIPCGQGWTQLEAIWGSALRRTVDNFGLRYTRCGVVSRAVCGAGPYSSFESGPVFQPRPLQPSLRRFAARIGLISLDGSCSWYIRQSRVSLSLEDISNFLHPVLRGWIEYHRCFDKVELNRMAASIGQL